MPHTYSLKADVLFLIYNKKRSELKNKQTNQQKTLWGSWVAQSVKHQTLAQVMISQLMSSSPTAGPVLTAQSLLWILCLLLSLPSKIKNKMLKKTQKTHFELLSR